MGWPSTETSLGASLAALVFSMYYLPFFEPSRFFLSISSFSSSLIYLSCVLSPARVSHLETRIAPVHLEVAFAPHSRNELQCRLTFLHNI